MKIVFVGYSATVFALNTFHKNLSGNNKGRFVKKGEQTFRWQKHFVMNFKTELQTEPHELLSLTCGITSA